jgi:hypothetical protein
VVKAFNTTFAGTLVAGEVSGQPLDVLIAGDDNNAKQKVSQLVSDGGLRPVDVGPLHRAQQLEQLAVALEAEVAAYIAAHAELVEVALVRAGGQVREGRLVERSRQAPEEEIDEVAAWSCGRHPQDLTIPRVAQG